MSLIPDIPEGQLCERCQLHKATLVASDSVMDYAHGFLTMFCQCCYLDTEIKAVEKAMERYPQLLKDIDAACRDEPPHNPRTLLTDNQQLRHDLERQWQMAHYKICASHYPDHPTIAANYVRHLPGEHCYWPRPESLK